MSKYLAPIKFIDLSIQRQLIRRELDVAIARVLDHGQYIMGPEVKEFEKNLCAFTKSKNALTCGNGTDALSLVLMGWDIGPGDAVFVPSFTYVATAEAPAQLGAIPFFVDVSYDSFNMDPDSFKQAIIDCKKRGLRAAAVVLVDLFGQPAKIDQISEIARSENVKILIDGAQSFGAETRGRSVGSMGDATTTSFFPSKPLGCYGDGGAVFTNDGELAEKVNSIRLHGKGSNKYDNVCIGLNSRLDTIQAAILLEKLKILPNELILRRQVADRYRRGIEDKTVLPVLEDDCFSAWAQFTLKVANRDAFQAELKEKNIPSVIYYPIPLSLQKGYSHYPSVSTGTSVSTNLSKLVISLPMHPYLSESAQDEIITEVNRAMNF